jgi:hypothetical protein
MLDKSLIHRFGVAYGALITALIAAVIATVVVFSIPKSPSTTKIVQAVSPAVAGDQNLIAMCEANITSSVTSNLGTVGGYSKPVVEHKGANDASVTVTLKSDIYSGRLVCTFHKSNWNVDQVQPA